MEKREKKNFRINDSISNVLEYLDEKKKVESFLQISSIINTNNFINIF